MGNETRNELEMGCEHSEKMTMWMSLALDGMLAADDDQCLQHHLVTCRECQIEWEGMQQVSVLFEQDPMAGPSLGFAIRVDRKLEEKARQRRRAFGGLAVLTSSLSLAAVTVGALIVVILAWQWLGSLPSFAQGTGIASQAVAGLGLMGKGVSLFLRDYLVRYGPPVVVLLALGLASLVGVWTWVFAKRPGRSHHNGYV